jgi:hypothetical protein
VARSVNIEHPVRVIRAMAFDRNRTAQGVEDRSVLDAITARLVYGAGPLP